MQQTRILFLSADPSDATRLRLGQEVREIREKLRLSKYRDKLILECRESVRPGDITQAIHDIRPDIVHFSGHGTKNGEICVEDLQGHLKAISYRALVNLFEVTKNEISCVVLNACYSEMQAREIAKYIPYTFGMSSSVRDLAAIAFSVGFYKAVASGRTFPEAFEFARVEIQFEVGDEYKIPTIHTPQSRYRIPTLIEIFHGHRRRVFKSGYAITLAEHNFYQHTGRCPKKEWCLNSIFGENSTWQQQQAFLEYLCRSAHRLEQQQNWIIREYEKEFGEGTWLRNAA